MAKRFIDTGLFDDSWFMDLSKDAKILWIYLFTKCDHAGIININEKLCKFQTGIKELDVVYKELGNRLVTVKEHYFFIPKFLYFQYPNFPNSNVKAQISAISRLNEFGLLNDDNITLSKELVNSYVYDNDNDYVNGNGKKEDDIYRKFLHLKITKEENTKLINFGYTQIQIDSIYDKIENFKKNTKYKSLYLTSLDWLKREYSDKSHSLNNINNLPSKVTIKKPEPFEGY